MNRTIINTTSSIHLGIRNLVRKNGKIYTISLPQGTRRFWNPFHSKMAALLLKEPDYSLTGIQNILYLGGGHGTTVSHLSDLIPNGKIFVVEFGIPMDAILLLAAHRSNIYPVMEDASVPSRYYRVIAPGSMDLLYQDISQRDQPGILLSNLFYLKTGGQFVFMVKIRSIAQDRDTSRLSREMLDRLAVGSRLNVHGVCSLEPYQKDHIVIYGTKM